MLFDFFYLASELKRIPRSGWKNKVGIEHPESVADHSYETAIMAMIFSDTHNLDTEKTLKMALLHDLAESIIGDFMPGEISIENKRVAENEAMKEILSKLPENIATKYQDIWDEYTLANTAEALLLHDIDKLEMAIQAMKYSSEGFSNEKLGLFIDSAKKEIKSKELLDMLDTLSYK
ncbi:MAG TPA: HD domain-containing protein [Candidatus Nitrosotalea sp.]|nr:HD domain-containing protein [Candidatus Nitrosotalea sp.]